MLLCSRRPSTNGSFREPRYWIHLPSLALVSAATCLVVACAGKPRVVDLGRSLYHQNQGIEIVVTLSDTLFDLSELLIYDTLSAEGSHLAGDGFYYDPLENRRLKWNGYGLGSWIAPVDQELDGPTLHCTVHNKSTAPLMVPCFACGPVWLFDRWSELGMFMRLSRGGSEFDTYRMMPTPFEPLCDRLVFDTIPAGDSVVYPVDVDVFLCALEGIRAHGFSEGQYSVSVVLRNPCWFESAGFPVVWIGDAESNCASFRIVDSQK